LSDGVEHLNAPALSHRVFVVVSIVRDFPDDFRNWGFSRRRVYGTTGTVGNANDRISALLLSRAGIGTQWVHCGGHLRGPQSALCERIGNATDPGGLSRQPKQARRSAGDAMVESGYASIYATETHKYAAQNGLADGNLEYAATHEIGQI
jgi:hypothetical protein